MRRSDGKCRSDSKVGKHFDEIVRLYELGWSTTRLAKRFGIDPSNVYRVLKSRGIIFRNKSESLNNAFALGIAKRPTGPMNSAWRGGRMRHTNGYVLIRMTDHHLADNRGYVAEHRLVAEKKLGRRLMSDEVVHHVNGNKTDNRPENLEILSESEHGRRHGYDNAMVRWHNSKEQNNEGDMKQ